jgi:hypothetical protein
MSERFHIDVPWDVLRTKRLFVATPMYGGQCFGSYTKSLVDLTALFYSNGMQIETAFLFNESLIQRARNYQAQQFLDSNCEHMMFIDGDVSFNPHDVLTLLATQVSDPEKYPVIGGVYPKKTICWEKVLSAVEQGFGKNNPDELSRFVGDYVFNPKTDNGQFSLNLPVEVAELGTGFMMIHRSVFEKFNEAYPHKRYRPDHVRSPGFDGSREITAFFDCIIAPDSKRYLSEDYNFCYDLQKIGLKTWILPWIKLTHTGTMIFGGSLEDLASIQASPTADISLLKKD